MQTFSIKKLIGTGLFTAPLFGLFGALPALVIEKIVPSRVPTAFLFITAITLVFWAINILMLWLSRYSRFFKISWVRHSTSIILSIVFLAVLFNNIRPKPVGPLVHEKTADSFFIKDRLAIEGSRGTDPVFHPGRPMGFRPKAPFLFPFIQAQSINIIIIILLELLLLKNKKQEIESENNQLRLANLEAKNNQLKQQLHPHFLFNSLSTLKSLIKRSPEDAEEYLLKLSELLRYSTNANTKALVSLQEELDLCSSYLIMQQVRFGPSLHFEVQVPESLQFHGKVPVYSVQLLVENAIKHNIITNEKPLYITISGDTEKQTVTVSNNLQVKAENKKSSGLGLSNLVERYQLLDNKEIIITKTNLAFSVTIKVMHDESGHY